MSAVRAPIRTQAPGDALQRTRTLVAALSDPLAYFHPADNVEVLETHISYVVLAGAFAYKIKKPLRLPFLDYSSLEARRRFCEEEVRLNVRTAPQLYRGAVPIGGTVDRPIVGGAGTPIEYAVRMERFEEASRFERIAARGGLDGADMDALAAEVARLHQGARRGPPDPSCGSPETIHGAAIENFRTIREAGGGALPTLEAWTHDEHCALRDFMRDRQRLGFVRECHGDLHLGNVVRLGRRPVPFDCIEFNDSFRWIDVVNDAAFMAMDLHGHGRPDLAARFIDRYLEATGDYGGLRVLRFYLVYRALVRAKVALIRARQQGPDAGAAKADRALFDAYVALAVRLSRPGSRKLVLMHGLSGSGKSTVAGVLVEHLGGLRLRSDVVRKSLQGLAPLDRADVAVNEGLYAPARTGETYEELAGRAIAVLQAGYPAIVDATFLRRGPRARFRTLALAERASFAIVDCFAPESLLDARVATRAASAADASDASLEVLAAQRAMADPLDAAERESSLACDTSDPLAAEEVAALLER